VTGFAAESGETNEIRVSWQPANDNVGIDHYQVYASLENGFTPSPETLLSETTVTGITYKAGLRETWHFRVFFQTLHKIGVFVHMSINKISRSIKKTL
jgi:hypothetical protein